MAKGKKEKQKDAVLDEAPNEDVPEPRLKRHYKETVLPQLKEQLGYTNDLAVPRLDEGPHAVRDQPRGDEGEP